MASGGCIEAMELMNVVFTTSLILNDGHEIFTRLSAGDEIADVVEEYATKFSNPELGKDIRGVIESWPPHHTEAVAQMVQWALGKLDTEDRITISWKGDAEYRETVTKFELRDHELLIEFAHPPGGLRAPGVSA